MSLRFLLAAFLLGPLSGQDLHIYFGNLHSHTAYSDGTGTPEQAYTHAREAGLDFLAITEHNHAHPGSTGIDPQNLLIATDHSLYNGPAASSLIETAKRINAQFAGSFAALYGQEFSSISKGNHSNVFDVGEVIDENEVPNGAYDQLYHSWLVAHRDSFHSAPVVQFNHPDANSLDQDYGRERFPTLEAFRAAAAPYVRTIAILNGPHDARPEDGLRRVNRLWSNIYLAYLNAGFRVAPTADQDNHFLTHGTSTDHRTAVLAPALTKQDILDGLRRRRVYASQDKNLEIRFTVNGQPLGSILALAPGTALQIQVGLRDPDEPHAAYDVILHRDTVGGPVEGQDEAGHQTAAGDSTVAFHGFTYDGGEQYFLVEVVQKTGPGPADHAWTAPVWLVPPDVDAHPSEAGVSTPAGTAPTFVWSRASDVYHFPNCRDAARISAGNRVSGPTPPAGRRLHTGCPR